MLNIKSFQVTSNLGNAFLMLVDGHILHGKMAPSPRSPQNFKQLMSKSITKYMANIYCLHQWVTFFFLPSHTKLNRITRLNIMEYCPCFLSHKRQQYIRKPNLCLERVT